MGAAARPPRRRAFDPWKLRAAAYRPFVETIRASLRHAGALRIDHALGLARLYWVPDGAAPTDGVYVRYPFADLLDVIARESKEAGAYVVAEDLGTSEPEILDALAARRLLSYRLVWFEEKQPNEYPELAMAAVARGCRARRAWRTSGRSPMKSWRCHTRGTGRPTVAGLSRWGLMPFE